MSCQDLRAAAVGMHQGQLLRSVLLSAEIACCTARILGSAETNSLLGTIDSWLWQTRHDIVLSSCSRIKDQLASLPEASCDDSDQPAWNVMQAIGIFRHIVDIKTGSDPVEDAVRAIYSAVGIAEECDATLELTDFDDRLELLVYRAQSALFHQIRQMSARKSDDLRSVKDAIAPTLNEFDNCFRRHVAKLWPSRH
jgi:hypothetical protein